MDPWLQRAALRLRSTHQLTRGFRSSQVTSRLTMYSMVGQYSAGTTCARVSQ